MLANREIVFQNGPIPIFKGEDPFLDQHVVGVSFSDIEEEATEGKVVFFWQLDLQISVYKVCHNRPSSSFKRSNNPFNFVAIKGRVNGRDHGRRAGGAQFPIIQPSFGGISWPLGKVLMEENYERILISIKA
eukprot:TRINITY_DN11036_c0_g1_i5.p2 TRINITY_DN11036_c0_g1~~TRINITY_DN11036_c0_g1_i5.p2  ORF type:complete len:132 (+),score=15.27 TRINITY_DN11036_c0_g1_i5:111-506(+)